MVRPGTSTTTVTEHRASVLPAAQLLPAAADVTVCARTLSPVSGLFTVTENVTVAVPPTARFPVQVSTGLVKPALPAVAVTSLS